MIKLLFLIAFSFHTQHPADSIGLETINGKTFVIHKVDEKETLYAISRRYRTTVQEILQYNPLASTALEIGQILKVPYTPALRKPPGGVVHTVTAGETLYSISRQYQVSVEALKQWNHLTNNALTIGQELVVKRTAGQVASVSEQPDHRTMISKEGVHTVRGGETLFSIARQYEVSVDQLKNWNHLTGNELSIGQNLYVVQPERAQQTTSTTHREDAAPVKGGDPESTATPDVAASPVKDNRAATDPAVAQTPGPTGQSAESIRISESLKTGDEIIEEGLAELIEGTGGNRKYLALHRTAPMGTILKVRNEMNNREVFVRVMGKLPDTAFTNKLIIKISKSAYDRLGAIDPRFRVEVTYYK